MSAEIRDEKFKQVVGESVELEQVATGFMFTEGPMWNGRTSELIFSDIPADTMHTWSAASGVAVYRQPSAKNNGNYFDRAGRLISCQHMTSRVVREEADGSLQVLASHYEGKELNSPNDVVVKADGSIYFTDPTYGRMGGPGVGREQDLDFQGVYRIDADSGELSLLASDFKQPNGLTFSLDEKQLFVNDTTERHIRVFAVDADGSLSGGEVWAVPEGDGGGACDGMKVDSAGNLYCTGPGGIFVYAPDATCLGRINVPEVAANFTWGDDDLQAVYITASTSLYRTRVQIAGRKIS